MQAQIGRNKTFLVSLHYNEQKVKHGTAERIKAENFLKEHDVLTRAEIIERFRQRAVIDRYKDRGFHFSLNFGEREKLSNVKMIDVTSRYMADMGFEDQPYVVYRHYDAGHPHLHVIATAVRPRGNLLKLEREHYRESKMICQRIEKEYSLEPGVGNQLSQDHYAVSSAQSVVYGERGLTRAVSDVLNTVIDHYNYTSLDELNAVLGQYNVEANPGRQGSRLRETGGLLYHALDDNGHRIGVPLKASKFLLKPTLKNLEQRFDQNQAQRDILRDRVSTAIEWALAGQTPDWAGFAASLERDGISIVVAKDDDRVFFVDHTGKSSFEGKNLGEGYVLASLQKRCTPKDDLVDEITQAQQLRLHL